MNDVVKTPANSFLTAMTSNVNVGIDEVVSVFVAKWEDGLFKKKDELSKKIKAAIQEMTDLVKRLVDNVNRSDYEGSIASLGISTKVVAIEVHFDGYDGDKRALIVVAVEVKDEDSKRSYGDSFTKYFRLPISQVDVDFNTELKTELEQLNAELVETMGEIKSVSRKERQVRGKISEMKLEQSGLAELAQNTEILKLIEVK